MYNIKESGARIKELQVKKGVTQEQMAIDLGVTTETVGRIERGIRGTSIDMISFLAEYFDTTIDYLVDGKEVNVCSELFDGLDEVQKAKVMAIMKTVIENI